jgi:uncharacterized membrane protein (UPF0127 family)
MVSNMTYLCLFSLIWTLPSGYFPPVNSSEQHEIFQTVPIRLGNLQLRVEIANTKATRSQGLMGRKNLPKNQVMLFVFSVPHMLSFWMKDTFIPLSIGFFDENKKLLQITDMLPYSKKGGVCKSYQSIKPSKYALEVNQGWFQKNGIEIGTEFSFLD